MADKQELHKTRTLEKVKDFFNSLVKTNGEETVLWAFRRLSEWHSANRTLLKKKAQLEKELEEVNSKL